jgi:histidinol-phosphate/aromatic aminotransferase/cobyric acid decarboxylase-like protein
MDSIQVHAGQDIYNDIDNLIEDFSTTTSYIGSNKTVLNNIKIDVSHYPKDDNEPYKTKLLDFLFKDIENSNPNLLFGNGASELIDLVIRVSTINNSYSTYYVPDTQYMEYNRSCLNANLIKVNEIENADIVSIVNPCNPTGSYMCIDELMIVIDKCKNGSSILIDESMQLWKGANFRNDSMLSYYTYIQNILNTRNIKIYIIHSYTKFFSCCGLRIGSILSPNVELLNDLLKYKNPWSTNVIALEYLNGCLNDDVYINNIWNNTKVLREQQIRDINIYFPDWKIHGVDFISWYWIELPDDKIAKHIYEISKINNVPIRWGKNGYNKLNFIRVAVRQKSSFDALLSVWKENSLIYESIFYYKFNNCIIETLIKEVNIDDLKIHEEYNVKVYSKLYDYFIHSKKILPTIIVDIRTNVIIDGHHRYRLFKSLNYKTILVTYIDYIKYNSIIPNPDNINITKENVIKTGISENTFKPKTTKHMLNISDNKLQPIIFLSTNIIQ